MSSLSGFSMLELFRMEAESQLEQLEKGLLATEQQPSPATFESMMRAAHSLKGAARIVGVRSAERLSHRLEDCLVAAQEGQLALEGWRVDQLLRCFDFISRSSQIADHEVEEWEVQCLPELETLLDGLTRVLSSESAELPLNHTTAPEIDAAPPGALGGRVERQLLGQEAQVPSIQESPAEKKSKLGKEAQGESSQPRTLRLAADRLDALLGLAGEAQVASSWLGDYNTGLLRLKARQAELAKKMSELGEALRESQAEASLLSRFQSAERLASECSTQLFEKMESLSGFDRRISNLSSRLHGEIVASRMRPFSDLAAAFPRSVRDLARTLGKELEFELHGQDTLVDRDILERLESPLNHLLRNAADHGIETAADRQAAGKPSQGKIRLQADHRGGMLCIEVEDDGAGLDHQKLRVAVVEKGLSSPEVAERLTPHELEQFLFLPGFTSKTVADQISGRGVGLDLVRSAIVELGGQIHVEARPGQGLRFQLILPLTLSVIHCLLVKVDGEPYAFPLSRLESVSQVERDEIEELEGRPYLPSLEAPLVWLRQVLELGGSEEAARDSLPVVVISHNRRRFGLTVDALVGEQDLVVHRLDSRLGKVPNVSSAAILDDGWPTLILDVDDLARNIERLLETTPSACQATSRRATVEEAVSRKRVLLVEDSITVREVERQLLVAMGLDVEIAVDGADGWNAARQRSYDLIITDIDMPRMDGFELVSLIKADPKLRATPVMIVSYKDREEDRRRGLEAGADYFLSKGSFHDQSLLEAVKELIP